MDKATFEALKAKVDEDLEINENNIQQKSLKLANIYNYYLKLYIQEFGILKYKTTEKNKKYQQKYHYYKFENQYQLSSAKEIEIYVNGDEEIHKINLTIQAQETIVKYLEQVLTNINNTGYRIKSYIDIEKIKHGLS